MSKTLNFEIVELITKVCMLKQQSQWYFYQRKWKWNYLTNHDSKMSVNVSTAVYNAKTIQYIIHRTWKILNLNKN